MPEKKSSLLPILLVNFISSLGFSIVVPFLVFLVTKFGGNAFVYGIVAAVYPAFQLIGAPILGKLSDVHGRKKILLLSEWGTFLGWGIFFIAFFLPNAVLLNINLFANAELIVTLPILILILARAVDGLTGGNISVANAFVADISSEQDRNKNFGKMSVSSNLGFIVGPAIAGILGGTIYGEMIPVIAAAVISFMAIVMTYLLIPDIKPTLYSESAGGSAIKKFLGYENKECFEAKSRKKSDEKINFSKVMSLDYVAYFIFLNFLIFLGFNFFYTAFPVHVVQKLGWSITQMGIFFSVLSLIMVIVQGPVLSSVSKMFSEKFLILTGSVILAVNFILLTSENIIVLYTAAVLFALGNGLMWPSFLSLLSKIAGKKYQGTVQGYASSAGSLASIVGLIAGGILYEKIGSATFLISAGVIGVVFLLSFRIPTVKTFAGSKPT